MTDITALEKLQDYRFGSLVKGKHYAYARGLTINPTHLPAALDAMEADGFTLVSVFGKTDAESVGFIFRINGPDPRVQELLAANSNLVLENRTLRGWIRRAVEQFRFYATSHRAKKTPDAEQKAIVNEEWVATGEHTLEGNGR